MMQKILQVNSVQKYYGNKGNVTKAVDNISFEVEKGEFVGIMGASGSGKTTLLNCISTIDSPTAGHIIINGTDITTMSSKKLSRFRREQLGFIFQDFNLLDTLTAYENIALALAIVKTPSNEIDIRVNQVAKELEIQNVLKKYPYEMSGGQTGALDSKSSRMLLESFETLNQALFATILMVTHDAFTASYCHRILFIKDGKIFNELVRGDDTRKQFFSRIIDVVTLLGGDNSNVL